MQHSYQYNKAKRIILFIVTILFLIPVNNTGLLMVICIHVHIHTYCGKKVTVVCLNNKLVIKEILKIKIAITTEAAEIV